ncbi:unnamed protein product [Closterium sp. Yama58-4]|nr:unnamed protein product [Closterium sp. Yama58-4]
MGTWGMGARSEHRDSDGSDGVRAESVRASWIPLCCFTACMHPMGGAWWLHVTCSPLCLHETLFMATPIDAAFLLLPILDKSRMKGSSSEGMFRSLDEICTVDGFPSYGWLQSQGVWDPVLPLITDIRGALPPAHLYPSRPTSPISSTLTSTPASCVLIPTVLLCVSVLPVVVLCGVAEVGSTRFYRLNDRRVLAWLTCKVSGCWHGSHARATKGGNAWPAHLPLLPLNPRSPPHPSALGSRAPQIRTNGGRSRLKPNQAIEKSPPFLEGTDNVQNQQYGNYVPCMIIFEYGTDAGSKAASSRNRWAHVDLPEADVCIHSWPFVKGHFSVSPGLPSRAAPPPPMPFHVRLFRCTVLAHDTTIIAHTITDHFRASPILPADRTPATNRARAHAVLLAARSHLASPPPPATRRLNRRIHEPIRAPLEMQLRLGEFRTPPFPKPRGNRLKSHGVLIVSHGIAWCHGSHDATAAGAPPRQPSLPLAPANSPLRPSHASAAAAGAARTFSPPLSARHSAPHHARHPPPPSNLPQLSRASSSVSSSLPRSALSSPASSALHLPAIPSLQSLPSLRSLSSFSSAHTCAGCSCAGCAGGSAAGGTRSPSDGGEVRWYFSKGHFTKGGERADWGRRVVGGGR